MRRSAVVNVSAQGSASPRFFDALVDTGAQRTFVSSNVVTHLGAVPVDLEPFLAANGQRCPTVVITMIGRPVSRSVLASLPFDASYASACSLTQAHVLGPYSPSNLSL
ncbi:hypothetical protein [Candidatus Poriferisodalis sp.]|uniref:hypothetical protein n=1 Tax=Candidatus Poriferisodalis sp. TaxID=3101277 RepID=UPI003B01B517